MLDAQQKATGTGYTAMCAMLSVGLAWVNWKRSSRISIASIATRKAAAT
jgi:hypothetical protein